MTDRLGKHILALALLGTSALAQAKMQEQFSLNGC
jgi:hypothetical protein